MRICLECGSDKTYIDRRNYECWHHYKDGWICHKCRHKLIDNPIKVKKWNPILNPIYNKRKIRFKDKIILLKENPRTGKCSWCGKQGLTHMHHIEYHDDDVLKDTIELCVGCHDKTHPKPKKRPLSRKIL